MTWKPRPPYRGRPQWTLEQMYITPFTARRRYDEEGRAHYDAMERNTAPTGIIVMDLFLMRMTQGIFSVEPFCKQQQLNTEDMDSLIYILTGLSGLQFRTAYQLRLVDDLLQYSTLPLKLLARRAGYGSHAALCVALKKHRHQTPTERQTALRKKGDKGRYRL